jgi:hypothetical protein
MVPRANLARRPRTNLADAKPLNGRLYDNDLFIDLADRAA